MCTILINNSQDSFIFGMKDYKSFELKIDDATTQQLQLYTDFLDIVKLHNTISVINSPYQDVDINFMVQDTVPLDFIDLDYTTLNPSDKTKFDSFIQMLDSIQITPKAITLP